MKSVIFFIMAVCLGALTACYGGSNLETPVDQDTEPGFQIKVAADGTFDYVGSGEFEGFAIFASNPLLAGMTLYLEKVESDYFVDGYVSLSSKYIIRLAENQSKINALEFYDIRVTLPFDPSILAAEGGTAKDVLVCGLKNEKVLPFDSSSLESGVVRANATIPLSFFAGYLKTAPLPEISGTIRLEGRSYRAAAELGEFLTDPTGVDHPDTARGIDHVQPGELVLLAVNQEAFGESVTLSSWNLSTPAGSASILVEDGDYQSFIADMAGVYTVSLVLEGINGKRSEESAVITAQNYFPSTQDGHSGCAATCHDGNSAPSGNLDQYGRNILRDLTSCWHESAHAHSFRPVEASTYTSCFKCHSTGFLFADRDLDGADDYMDASGFDDTITDWQAPAATGSRHLQGVTCEACHGPGIGGGPFADLHYKKVPTGSHICLSCHANGDVMGHFFGYSDAHDQAHALAGGNVSQNAECFKCHTGEGMLGRIFAADITPANTTSITGLGCPVCHDPHNEQHSESQLRITGDFLISLAAGDVSVDAGKALLCYNCHNADTALPAVGTIPHNSQAELLNGVGGYDYGQNLPPMPAHHSRLACSDCHMKHLDGITHEMNMTVNAAERIASCRTSPCHATASPEFADGHYDMNGNLVNVRAGIQQLADTINNKAGLPADSPLRATYSTDNHELNQALNRAAYNCNFILSDKSSGFHNPVYVEKLIELSLDDLDRY